MQETDQHLFIDTTTWNVAAPKAQLLTTPWYHRSNSTTTRYPSAPATQCHPKNHLHQKQCNPSHPTKPSSYSPPWPPLLECLWPYMWPEVVDSPPHRESWVALFGLSGNTLQHHRLSQPSPAPGMILAICEISSWVHEFLIPIFPTVVYGRRGRQDGAFHFSDCHLQWMVLVDCPFTNFTLEAVLTLFQCVSNIYL